VTTQRSANLLRDELAFLRTRIDDLVTVARRSGRTTYVLDNYISRVFASSVYGAFYGYEYGTRP